MKWTYIIERITAMNDRLIFFEPVPRITIWGGEALNQYFGYHLPGMTGQCWVFADQTSAGGAACKALGDWTGEDLHSIFTGHPELFNSKYNEFPFILTLVGPIDDLSLQVHPDEQYAAAHGLPGAKHEAWVPISCKSDYKIVYNMNARSPEELQQYIDEKRWYELICHENIRPGQGVYIPAGILHAMGKGCIMYEIQERVDVTYRFWDYDRVDAQGGSRPLALEEAKSCLHYEKYNGVVDPDIKIVDNAEIATFISNTHFTVQRIRVNGKARLHFDGYACCTVSDGGGVIDGTPVKLGENFLATAKYHDFDADGNFELMLTME